MSKAKEFLVQELLAEGRELLRATSSTPDLDARILLEYSTGLSRVQLVASPLVPIGHPHANAYRQLLARRSKGEPISHLIGKREFYGREFIVTPDVLDPRPETELLVEQALAACRESRGSSLHLLDLGTGSGCIAVTLALELRTLQRPFEVIAVDISDQALAIAAKNAERHAAEVKLQKGDWFSGIASHSRFDVIVSNPPYIAQNDPRVSPETCFEPSLALFAGPTGLEAIERLVSEAAGFLKPGGIFIFETGTKQHQSIRELVKRIDAWAAFESLPDLAGHERIVRLAARR